MHHPAETESVLFAENREREKSSQMEKEKGKQSQILLEIFYQWKKKRHRVILLDIPTG